jgi:hypothetical protein
MDADQPEWLPHNKFGLIGGATGADDAGLRLPSRMISTRRTDGCVLHM